MVRPIHPGPAPRRSTSLLGCMKTLIYCMMLILVCGVVNCSENNQKMEFSIIDTKWSEYLNSKRKVFAKLSHGIEGENVLEVIQIVIDRKMISKDEQDKLHAIGVAFGDYMALQYNLEWVVVKDAYGVSPVLKPPTNDVAISAMTMIAKRVEDGETVNVTALYNGIEKIIEKDKMAEMRHK